MDARGTSGDEGLDLILGGGLPMNGINLIMGLPGSGKTMLCQQLIFAGATEARPALYLSTVSEPFEKILRYAQTLSFFERDAIISSVSRPERMRSALGRIIFIKKHETLKSALQLECAWLDSLQIRGIRVATSCDLEGAQRG